MPRFPSSHLPSSLSDSLSKIASRTSSLRQSRLTVGAAGAALAAAGIVAGVAATASPAAAAASNPVAISHPGGAVYRNALSSGGTAHFAAAQGPGQQAPLRTAAPTTPKKPYLIYDSVTPSAIPAHKVAATYATGGYAVQPSAVSGHKQVYWIDTQGTDPKASSLDVEPGDATPSVAASWVSHRLNAYPHQLARIYTMRSEWPAVQAAVGGLPHWMQHQVRWWIADPTGSPHVVPGSQATQWYWGSGYDISTATPGF